MQWLAEIAVTLAGGLGLIALLAAAVWLAWRYFTRRSLPRRLKRHFGGALPNLAVTDRQFPLLIRADVERAVEDFLQGAAVRFFAGVESERPWGGADLGSLLDQSAMELIGANAAPPQYEQIDIGEDQPLRTLTSGLWLVDRNGVKAAVLYAPLCDFGACGITRRMRLQIATDGGEDGQRLAADIFRHVEQAVQDARSYRGKVLSLESDESYSGQSSGVKVHRLRAVARDEVILPAKTLDLLDRNVVQFVRRREGLRKLNMATKKGLLFYGPPGTGKTHTIRYLAGSLSGHTTFLISAEQVGLLGEYMTLARLLQPSVVVIEDVDLIARERTSMSSPQAELLLNKLLNEMDGLREDCEILFILTTNRPEELEGALASRPGRIDQAIEFSLPDAAGREKLVRLYAGGLRISDELAAEIVNRTDKVSASFIKELMRRTAQFLLQRDGTRELVLADVENALGEMLFVGGSLNLKLLGASHDD